MDKTTKTTWIYLSITFILTILIFALGIYFRKKRGEQIQSKIDYSIGIYLYTISGGKPIRTDVYFNFEIQNKIFERMKSSGKITGYKNAQEGNEYLVIYDKTNPENCQILFDYPINDSTDFKRYLQEFKTKPLDISKYF